MKTLVMGILSVLMTGMAFGQTEGERYFVVVSGGWGPAAGARGEGSVGVRVGSSVYSLTSANLAGGEGAVTEDLLYRAATARGVTLWGRVGGGFSTANTPVETTTKPMFGGGLMLSYDASKISPKFAGLEFVFSTKLMYGTTVETGLANTTVRPMYQFGLKFSWQ